MAVKTKKSSRKKTTAGKKSRGRVGNSNSCKAVGSRKKVGEKSYKVAAYKSTKSAAQKVADNHRSKGKGKLARVVSTTCAGKKTYQVLTYG